MVGIGLGVIVNVGMAVGVPVGEGVALLVGTGAVPVGVATGGRAVRVGEGTMARAGTVGVGFASDMPTRIMKSEILDPMSMFSFRATTDTRARMTNSDAMNPQPPHPGPEGRALIWIISPFPELPAPDGVGSGRRRPCCSPLLAEVVGPGDTSCPAGSL